MVKPESDGSLTACLPLYEKLAYELSNRTVVAQADGSFSLSRYGVAGRCVVFEPDTFYTALSIDGCAIEPRTEKHITMLGRVQSVSLEADGVLIECSTFLDEATQAVFQRYTLTNTGSGAVVVGAAFGWRFAPQLWLTSDAPPEGIPGSAGLDEGFAYLLPGGLRHTVECSAQCTQREIEGRAVHLNWEASVEAGGQRVVHLAHTLRDSEESLVNGQLLASFDGALEDAREFQCELQAASCGTSPLERAMYASALNCALSSYKHVGSFEGFYAGVDYQAPPRTYYRDGYFTALPVLVHHPELVRSEITTLALGIAEDGTCPSAVVDADTVFWPDHEDSPAYFIMMVHDYLAATGDLALLDEVVKGRTILDHALILADMMLDRTDDNHLLYRRPPNRHDWADNVFREGYVTYVEALLFRAIHCAGRIADTAGHLGADRYNDAAAGILEAINTMLWNEDKGWYNNYQSEHFVEDNLSIDTILCVVFGIVGADRSARLLANMERFLESKNNSEQPFGDWGTMCCWPPYKHPTHLVEKSAYPFVYHNGSDWPFWSTLYAFAKSTNGLDGKYPLTRWFTYALDHGWTTPVEYFNPVTGRGSLLQGWSAMAAFTLRHSCRGQFPFEL